MLYYDIKENMPKSKVHIKRKNMHEYVYYTTKAYRNKKGKPTSDEVSIGKFDRKSKKLIPNDNYFEIFKDRRFLLAQLPVRSTTISEPEKVSIHEIKNCAIPVVMQEVAKQTQLLDVISATFPTKWAEILTIASYIVDQSSTMMYIEDWFEENKINLVDHIDDVMCSKLFASITHEERQSFFREWMNYRCEKECMVYDVTSISTYSQNIEIAEWGYNRDHEKIPQVNLGLFYGVSSKIPVYYDVYSGSIPDKSCLEYMMANAKDIGIDDICFVLDQGFVTKDNFSCMYENKYSFITAFPLSRTDAQHLVESVHNSVEKAENWINEHRVYGVHRTITLYGHTIEAHVYFDNERKTMQTNEHYTYIERLGQELKEMSKKKQIPNRYSSYFIINEQSKNSFTFEPDYEKTNAKLAKMGYFILLCTKPNLSSKEVLDNYRDKDVIEKHFDQFKNGLEFNRLKTHYQNTSEGKLFVGFLALILRSHILSAIKNNKQIKHFTFEKVMIELRKIKSVLMSNNKEILKPLTSTQKNILDVLNVKIEKLLK